MADEIKTTAAEAPESRNFIHAFIEEDIALSIILAIMNVYWYCYEAMRMWGVAG